jgi:hypothetical protein
LRGDLCHLPQQAIHLAPVDWPRRVPRDHGCAAPAFQLEPAFVGEQPVGEGHGVEVDAEIEGQLANRRQLVAGLETGIDQMPAQIVGDLPVGRNRGVEVERYSESAPAIV